MARHTLQGHTSPLCPPPGYPRRYTLLPNPFLLGPLLGIFPVVRLGSYHRQQSL